jgi:hypothetical protein
MKSDVQTGPIGDLRGRIDLPASDAAAILRLLGTAQASIKNHGDAQCAHLLAECESDLRERYGLAALERRNDSARADSSIPALLHLLIYVQAEMRDKLGDAQCTHALTRCIDRLLHTHQPYSERVQASRERVVTSH